MRVLVAGATGQLAHALQQRARRNSSIGIVALERPHLDLADPASISASIDSTKPDLVVNAAAYTAVDRAESDAEAAFSINRDGARILAATAAANNCPIIHISTDYVFDGRKSAPYVEDDAADPQGVYGRSKLEGEAAVAAANQRHVILRTAWLYGAHGHNFLKTILRLASERPELRVVADQRGNPTYAPHLADAVLAIAGRLAGRDVGDAVWGVYHAAAAGETTWHGFAAAIVAAAKPLGMPQVPVIPITTADYPTPARRPANSRLDCGKLERTFGVRLPAWEKGVSECMGELERETHRAVA
jgi:dTDP-4-dehydrorhamnose reductase